MNPVAYLLPVIVVAVAMAILQLVAVWAGVSRRSWFVRALAICLVFAAMLPIRALEPIVWHALALPLTAVCSRWLWRRLWDQPRGKRDAPGVRFSLQQVFLLVLLAAGLSAVPDYLATVPLDPWSGKPVIWRKTADGVVVYAVGSDGKDDGGRFGGYTDVLTTPGFDYDLGVADR